MKQNMFTHVLVRGLHLLVIATLLAGLALTLSPLMPLSDWRSASAAPVASPGVFPVNSTLDLSDACPGDGVCAAAGTCLDPLPPCTLRAAIEEANATPGPHTISFTIAGTIQPLFQLPTITQPFVTTDGPTPPGDIVLDGSLAGLGANGLVIQTSNTTVRGLVIHGFDGNGIVIQGGTGNTIAGNFIGTNVTGNAPVPNQAAGVLISNAPDNTVGGATAAQGNLISGNAGEGVVLLGADATGNSLQRNLIGTQADGASALGNGAAGVFLDENPSDNSIGPNNTIAYNGGDGVWVRSGTGNTIKTNSIFTNTELGIDLGTDNTVTPNDEYDPDAGANNLQNFPVLTSASSTTTGGVLDSTPNTTFTIQFFSSPTLVGCDPSGFGEGQTFLGQASLPTDGSGHVFFTAGFSLPDGNFVTATATDPYGNTSEFSNCIEVPSAPVLSINKEVQDLNGGAALPGDTLLYTINYSNTGNAPATGVFITDGYSAYCATISDISNGDFPDHDDDGARIRWPATGGILLGAQASGSVSYRCTLDDSFPDGTTNVINTSTIESDQTTPEQDTETVPVTAAPVLTINKQVQNLNGGSAEPGDTLRYTIHYTNTGNAPSTGVFITDDYSDLCATISNVTTDGNFLTFSDTAGVLRWPQDPNTATLAAGASGSLCYDCTLQASFPAGTADVTNTSTINSNETDPEQDMEMVLVTRGIIVINKQTDPAGGTGFVFTDTIALPNTFTLDDGGTNTFNEVIPDTYTITETDPLVTPGHYNLTNLGCVEDKVDNSTEDLDNRRATINLDPGETITCTFTNTYPPPVPVGGYIVPVNELELLRPWITLVALVIISAIAVMARKRRDSEGQI